MLTSGQSRSLKTALSSLASHLLQVQVVPSLLQSSSIQSIALSNPENSRSLVETGDRLLYLVEQRFVPFGLLV